MSYLFHSGRNHPDLEYKTSVVLAIRANATNHDLLWNQTESLSKTNSKFSRKPQNLRVTQNRRCLKQNLNPFWQGEGLKRSSFAKMPQFSRNLTTPTVHHLNTKFLHNKERSVLVENSSPISGIASRSSPQFYIRCHSLHSEGKLNDTSLQEGKLSAKLGQETISSTQNNRLEHYNLWQVSDHCRLEHEIRAFCTCPNRFNLKN